MDVTVTDIVKLCTVLGASKAEAIPVESVTFAPELRSLCEQNVCGRFGRNYTCPPLAGDVHTLIANLKTFRQTVIWQNIYPLEDSFDFEGMAEGQRRHNAMTADAAERIYAVLGRENALVLAAGGCALCQTCAVLENRPCRFPEKALSSLEAYGINVSKIGEISNLKYINGPNTVTFFSGVFFR
ncbi:MAG: DUF2284 domain-containing protein [Oscillospiraceae bacterium]|jgi:predicted metal-binding protein|nr:DUF2284 domain-containing protein [Oscillospiraceae bacterium]